MMDSLLGARAVEFIVRSRTIWRLHVSPLSALSWEAVNSLARIPLWKSSLLLGGPQAQTVQYAGIASMRRQ